MNFTVAEMKAEDWEAVRAIYQEGIATGIATFETDVPTWEQWDTNHLGKPRLVARAEGQVASPARSAVPGGDQSRRRTRGRLRTGRRREHRKFPYDQVIGWAALSHVSGRCVYSGVAEVSVYVAVAARGLGVGKALLEALAEASEREGIWTLQAGIFPENEVSIALHKACAFREVGYRERIGQMNGVWRDVVLLERRSKVVGI